ncbi:GEVED domain-containing protein [Hymenobacter ruricola]|uniref:T9SS type A sorting domain-containing protein n=1 Tax=Hymenobacter ruricola TaxID=2791023 RepID=A0ABS0I4Z5_9BACT|nr:GEVED domain-containing protein [Hymenobacter ruricola]MBF9221975.1 T9SS type A sorting domain-containing protein [Hymenobacter ruricola]
MKKNVYAVALSCLGLALAAAPAHAQTPTHRTCASQEVLEAQLAADPGLAQRMAAINNQALQFAANKAGAAQQRTSAVTVTIPVVVHVVYGTTSENISDAQIQSQIDVLNEDYHKLNADYTKTPSAFAGLVADVGIQFTLAKRDPNGNATTGIERKSQAAPSGGWGTADKIKKTTYGGLAAWPSGQYLNLWVGTIGGGILGYAQFPGGAAATDGVVISPVYFGRTGTVTAPYNLGRTASHEVGHWLNLNHIWGDDGTACTGTDNVSDTPNQADENYGKPVFPQVSCSNGPNGDMFMNYMDYVDDAAMFMFSTGQSSRMNALFASGGARASLLTSQGGVAPGGTTTPPTTVTYCASKGSSVAYEYLDLVQLGSINRASGADGGYYNGTALSTSVAAGSTQTISFSTGFATSSTYTEYVKVYADWNQNGVFTDAGELLVSAAGSTSAATRTGSFAVPATAISGNTRLRVTLSDNSGTTSCGSYSYGETEDYTLVVTGGTARTSGSTARQAGGNGAADRYTLYPNPATEVLSIARPLGADPEQAFTVRVYDLRGSEIQGLALDNGQLNVSALRAGIYLLSVSDANGTTHQRFVKE